MPYLAVAQIGLWGIDSGVFRSDMLVVWRPKTGGAKFSPFALGFESSAFLRGMRLEGFRERALTLRWVWFGGISLARVFLSQRKRVLAEVFGLGGSPPFSHSFCLSSSSPLSLSSSGGWPGSSFSFFLSPCQATIAARLRHLASVAVSFSLFLSAWAGLPPTSPSCALSLSCVRLKTLGSVASGETLLEAGSSVCKIAGPEWFYQV